jgi:hypothetical protein
MTNAQAKATFDRLRGRMARRYPVLASVRLRLVDRHFLKQPTARDLAWYEGGVVTVLRRALRGPVGRLEGLLAHELGHAADPDTDRPYAERRADALAKAALGAPIRYDNEDVQNLDHGVTTRPARLHENREDRMQRNPKAKFKPAVDARGKPIAVGDTVLILSGRLEDYTVNVTGVDDDGEYCRVEVGYQHMAVPCKECVVRRKPVVANPHRGYHMPEAQARHTAEGLLARMLADGADTFAKKVKWVKRHMPNIDRPRTFVGWVTKGERGRMVRNPSPAYHRTRGDAELVLAEDSYRKAQTLRRRGNASGSHDALIHAHRMAALAEADLLDGASPKAADAKRLAWWKAYSGLAADKRRNPSLNVRNPSKKYTQRDSRGVTHDFTHETYPKSLFPWGVFYKKTLPSMDGDLIEVKGELSFMTEADARKWAKSARVAKAGYSNCRVFLR